MRIGMGHTAVSATQPSSVTLYIWQHGAKENYRKFGSQYKDLNYPNGAKFIKCWLENESKPIINF